MISSRRATSRVRPFGVLGVPMTAGYAAGDRITSFDMARVTVQDHLTLRDQQEIRQLVARVEQARGFRPLSDQAWIAFQSLEPNGTAAVVARSDTATDNDTDTSNTTRESSIVGYAHVELAAESATCEVVVDPTTPFVPTAAQLLSVALTAVSQPLYWWAFDQADEHIAVAKQVGLRSTRQLLQMRRTLPVTERTPDSRGVQTRPFVPWVDNEAWLQVNNRAFAWHPEQSGWTADMLEQRIREPWFNADGFLLHEVHGRLAGFCWTKIHADDTPPIGEIYVIAADPDFAGRGLGTGLTLAGLDWLARAGMTIGMLYVDASNRNAVAMYERLGFVVFRTDVMYSSVTPSSVTPSSVTPSSAAGPSAAASTDTGHSQ